MAEIPPGAGALQGLRVIVTRPLHQAGELQHMLESHGAETLLIPAIEIQAPANSDALDEALRNMGRYGWAVFTSANAVDRVSARARELGLPLMANLFENVRVCAIGTATKAVLASHGCPVALMPNEYVAESLAEAFESVPLHGVNVLLPRAAVARDIVPDALRQLGATVDVVEAYRNGIPADSSQAIADLLARGTHVDWLIFTSGSTVKNFLAMGGKPLLKAARVASIGPATSAVAAKHGVTVDAEAAEHTAEGLVRAMLQYRSAPNP